MKIDRGKVRKSSSDLPLDCQKLIEYLCGCTEEELLTQLKEINIWYFGKCELYHWIDVLDRFDDILESVAKNVEGKTWVFAFDTLPQNKEEANVFNKRELIHQVLKFTALLIEHSYARHLYNSIEHLISLMDCGDASVILSVLNLIYVFSKRSNYLSRMTSERRKNLQQRLFNLGETWGGIEAGYGLDQCCSTEQDESFKESGSLYFECYIEEPQQEDGEMETSQLNRMHSIHLSNLQQMSKNPGDIMEQILTEHNVPKDVQISLLYRLRLAHSMPNLEKRIQFVQLRLQAISILVYSNATDQVNSLVYDGFVEEIVNTLELPDERNKLSDVKASCLKTLTAIIHLDRNPRLNTIVECTGALSYHGFLPALVRQCISHMTDGNRSDFPQPFSTALFSFLYHLASYESGCEALVSCGLMESLLKVVRWPGADDHITFVTRAVRVIDLITNLDMASFQTHNGLSILVNRLKNEVKSCSKYHGPILPVDSVDEGSDSAASQQASSSMAVDCSDVSQENDLVVDPQAACNQGCSDTDMKEAGPTSAITTGSISIQKNQCLPQRAALLKSILNFLKKTIPDPAFADHTRSLMDETLQYSLKLIISNAEYYGALLFLLATDVVTVYIFHEPSMLSSLQESGLTGVVLKSLIVKDVPATRENLASLPNTLSALCLNTTGLRAFMACNPFERLFRILITPEYLPAMKRRRSSDPQGDTAIHLGTAMDELMRHQPTLKTDAMKAIIKLLEHLCEIGNDPQKIAFHPYDKSKPNTKHAATETMQSSAGAVDEPMSDEDMEEDFAAVVSPKINRSFDKLDDTSISAKATKEKREYIPLLDYLLNVMKFLENILSNQGTDDHCAEFISLHGLSPLLGLLNLSNMPLEFPLLPACQSVAAVCKSIVILAQDNKVFKEGLTQLDLLLDQLSPLCQTSDRRGSVLLHELASNEQPGLAMHRKSQTPLLHAMSATHAYINMFVHICRGSQSEVRVMSLNQWGSDLGKRVLGKLSLLYTYLVWESSVLLTLCTPNLTDDEKIDFARDDLSKLVPKDIKESPDPALPSSSNGKAPLPPSRIAQLRLIKWLLTSSSHLGRALAELFGLLVHQCVAPQPRLRRHLAPQAASMPSLQAKFVAEQLTKVLIQGLSWVCPEDVSILRLRLTFYICSIGFAAPMLFDEKENPYHLMLQQFEMTNGLECVIERFQWVLDRYQEHSNVNSTISEGVQDGTSEFLESWLVLMEKMVNMKAVLETTHALPTQSSAPGFVKFDPVEFLVRTQKLAFDAVMMLWDHKLLRSSSNEIAEKVLSILCHIIKGEGTIREKIEKQSQKKQDVSPENKSSTPTTTATTPTASSMPSQRGIPISPAYVHQIVDMGFTEAQAREALQHCRNNLVQATEHVLSLAMQPQFTDFSVEGEVSEDDMMRRAIALSLGETIAVQEDAGTTSDLPKKPARTKSVKTVNAKKPEKIEPISKEVLDKFTEDLLPGCLQMLVDIPDTVHTVYELIVAVAARNGEKWKRSILEEICSEVQKCANEYLSNSGLLLDQEASSGSKGSSWILSTRLHLLLLLTQEMQFPVAAMLQQSGAIDVLLLLMEAAESLVCDLPSEKNFVTPKWVASLVLLLDQYQKAADAQRRKTTNEFSHTWKWFDDRTGRWCNYSGSNNSSIDNAYHSGETSVRFTAGRRRYIVLFKVMVQINEDTGNRRPIMLDIMSKARKESTAKPEESKSKETNNSPKKGKRKRSLSDPFMDVDSQQPSGSQDVNALPELRAIEGLKKSQMENIVRTCTRLIASPISAAALNAVMRLTLRLTRDFQMASIFSEEGGPRALLKLTEKSSFPGAIPLATLLLRHIVEDVNTLQQILETVICVNSHGVGNTSSGVGHSSVGTRELHYVLRTLGPAACRSPSLFKEAAMKLLRIQLPTQLRRGQTDEHELSIPPNSPQLIKIAQSARYPPPRECHLPLKELVTVLLDSLVELHVEEQKEGVKDSSEKSVAEKDLALDESVKESETSAVLPELSEGIVQQADLVRRLTGEPVDDDDNDSEESRQRISSSSSQDDISSGSLQPSRGKKKKTSDADKSNARLFSKSTVLKLLAELTKSYPIVARLISDHLYTSKGNEKASKFDGSILAFIFDYLLPVVSQESSETSNVPALSRTLLAVIGSCSQLPEVQNSLIVDLKSSLVRALNLPESKLKHSRLQALFNLILTIIESTSPQSGNPASSAWKLSFIRLLIKKGLINDLAKTPHSLDLSSPYLVSTVNSMLKPLEKLTSLAHHQALTGKTENKEDGKENSERTENQGSGQQANAGPLHTSTEETTVGNGTTEAMNEQETQNTEQQTLGDSNAANIVTNGSSLENIIGQILQPREGESNVIGETICTMRSGDGSPVVEQRIIIEARRDRNEGGDSESVSSDSSREMPAEEGSDGSDDDDDDDMSNDEEANSAGEEVVESDEEAIQAPPQESSGTGDALMITFSGLDEVQDGSAPVIGEEQDAEDEHHHGINDDSIDTLIIEEAANDEDDDDDDDDDEDDQDDEGEDDDDDDDDDGVMDGLEMDTEFNGDNIEDSIGFFHDDLGPLGADNDEQNATIEINFSRRPNAIHFPLTSRLFDSDTQDTSSSVNSSILQHPLLLRQTGTDSRAAGHRVPRSRGTRNERPGQRHNHPTHTLHIHNPHSSGTSFARILVGDNMRVLSRNFDEVGDDFLDGFDDNIDSFSNPVHAVPNALNRWALESRLLDGMGVHDCVNEIKLEIIEHLVKLQAEELEKKREEERKKKLDAAENLGKSENGKVKEKKDGAKSNTTDLLAPETPSTSSSLDATTATITSAPTTSLAVAITPSDSISTVVADSAVRQDPISLFRELPPLPTSVGNGLPTPANSIVPAPTTATAAVSDGLQVATAIPPSTFLASLIPIDRLRGSEEGAPEIPAASSQQTSEPLANLEDMISVPTAPIGGQPASGLGLLSDESVPREQPPVTLHETTPHSILQLATPTAPLAPRTASSISASNPFGGISHNLAASNPSELAVDIASAILSQLTTASTAAVTSNATVSNSVASASHPSSVTGNRTTETLMTAPLPVPLGLPAEVNTTGNSREALSDQTAPSTQAEEEQQAGPSGLQNADQVELGVSIPDGVDPSFLDALPEDIRREVLRDHLGVRGRSNEQRTETQDSTTQDVPLSEVSPDFLAALPSDIQEEVLEQQRLERARQQAAQTTPDQPVDPAAFIRNLAPSLRRQVLADMDDSVLAVLPPDVSSEALGLRRELEQRQAQYFQERAFEPTEVFSQLLRSSGARSRHRGLDGTFQFTPIRRLHAGVHSGWGIRQVDNSGNLKKILNKQLVDHESLSCLLVLLFLGEPKLNVGRLHRVLRNVSFHKASRLWIIKALISIVGKTGGAGADLAQKTHQKSPDKTYKHIGKRFHLATEQLSDQSQVDTPRRNTNNWLSRTLDSSFGHRVDLFDIKPAIGKSSDKGASISVHPHAASFVNKHVIEALLFLAKNFPASFTPYTSKKEEEEGKAEDKGKSQESKDAISENPEEKTREKSSDVSFWTILYRLNSIGPGRKGKMPLRTLKDTFKEEAIENFDSSPIGQILIMLSHPVIKRNTTLIDKLLRLLAVVSMSLPDTVKPVAENTPAVVDTEPAAPVTTQQEATQPTVTFAPDDIIVERSPLVDGDLVHQNTGDVAASDHGNGIHEEETDQDAIFPGSSHFSETSSITSSLFVEGSPAPVDTVEIVPTGAQSPRAESVVSCLSDGTYAAHSDISGMAVEPHEEPMEIDRASHAVSDTSSNGTRASPVNIPLLSLANGPYHNAERQGKEPIVNETQLRLAVNVLTSGVCSEDGLEDATTLLLQLSKIDKATRDSVLALLLDGARDIAYTLCGEIKILLIEIREYNSTHGHEKQDRDSSKSGKKRVGVVINPTAARSQPWRGRGRGQGIHRRLGGSQGQRPALKPVIFDLHLPAMACLTGKRSSQNLLLRVLKVVIQLREAAKKSLVKGPNQPRTGLSRGMRLLEGLRSGRESLREVVAALEADVEAMYELIDRYDGERNATQGSSSTDSEQQSANSAQRASNAQAGGTSSQGDSMRQNELASAVAAMPQLPRLSSQIVLDELWDMLGECLTELAETSDANAVLILQPAVEVFFLVHGSDKDELQDKSKKSDATDTAPAASLDLPPFSPGPLSPGGLQSPSRQSSISSISPDLPADTQKFLKFAETHRVVLNQILRQSTTPLSDGPFAVLVNHTRLLDFDVKRRYFRQELEKLDKGVRREDMAVHVRREHVFEDSYRELHRKSKEEMKNRLYIVFDGEEGQDAGGLLREWYLIIAREMFNPNYALFATSQGDKNTYLPNRNSHCNPNHLSYFKFVGRIVAKAIYDNKLLDCYFTRSCYKHILDKKVHYTDMEVEDYSFYQGLVYLLEHEVKELGYDLTFSVEVPVFGMNEIHDLKQNGRNTQVTEENKREYVKLVCQEKMIGSIRQQMDSFLEGFYEIIPKRLISIFDEQELELLIAGLPTIDIEDLRAHTEYHKYDVNSMQVQWFWRALRSFDQADRAKFLQFVTGTSKVPLQGFAALEGMNGPQKFQIHRDDRSTDRLPSAHTCFNQLDLPPYGTYEKLHMMLMKAIHECPEGFGLA